MRPREGHPPHPGPSPAQGPEAAQHPLSPARGGKAFGGTPAQPRGGRGQGTRLRLPPARRPHARPQPGCSGLSAQPRRPHRGPRPLHFYPPTAPALLDTRTSLPNRWARRSCPPKALEADKHTGHHTVRDNHGALPGNPFSLPGSVPSSAPQRKVTVSVSPSLSISQPLSLLSCPSHGLYRYSPGETENLPNRLNLFVGQNCHPEIFQATFCHPPRHTANCVPARKPTPAGAKRSRALSGP